MTEICANCEKETEVKHVHRDEAIVVRGEAITVPVAFYRCTECGAGFRDPREADDPLDRAYGEYRRRRGMVQPEEFRAFRRRQGMTQEAVAELLGWAVVTVRRYEDGALQGEGQDAELKVIMDMV